MASAIEHIGLSSPATAVPPDAEGPFHAADHLWMHFTRMGSFATNPVPIIERGEGAYIYDTNGRRIWTRCPDCSWCRPGYGRDEIADAAAGRPASWPFFPIWSYATPTAIELADRLAAAGPGRPEQGLLLLRRRRIRRDRVETRQAVLQAHRQAEQDQGDQPGDRLPRHHPGRAVHHRRPGLQARLRTAGPRRVPGAQHRLLPRAGASSPTTRRRSAVGPPTDRGSHPAEGPDIRRRGVRRTRAERRRLFPAAARLLRAAAGDLRHPRCAARLRRGDLRLRPAGHHVRRREVRLPARHHHLGQGSDLRATHRSARRSSPIGSSSRSARAPRRSRTATPSAATRSPAPSALANLDVFEKRTCSATCCATRTPSARPWKSCSTCRSSGDVRGNGYFCRSSWSRTRRTKETFTRAGLRAHPARLRLTRDVGGRRLLPRRRPRPDRRAVRSAADLRPGGVRPDRIRDAVGPHRGVGATLRKSCTARQAFRSQT